MALRADPLKSLVSSHVDKYMIEGAFNDKTSLFVSCCGHEVASALLAEANPTLRISIVFITLLHTPHAAIFMLLAGL